VVKLLTVLLWNSTS